MVDQHRFRNRGFRPDPVAYTPALTRLQADGREMNAFLGACLAWFNDQPDQALATLQPFWPAPRPWGAPRRDDDGPSPAATDATDAA